MPRRPVVLIADDEPVIAQTLVQILGLEGYDAASVGDGAAAVDWVQHRNPDLVVCDVMLPNLSGIEAAKQIHTLRPDSKIILFSGQTETTALVQQAQGEGFDFELVTKPVRPDVLLGIIKRLIAERHAERELGGEPEVMA